MLPELTESPVPSWLANAKLEDPIPIGQLLSGSVFYPASGFDGRPVKYLAGFSHSFVCADWHISRQEVLANLDSFKGYRLLFSRFVEKEELCFNSYRAIPFKTTYYMGEFKQTTDHPQHIHWPRGFQPFAEWAVYERLPGFDKDHGPERFSLLFVGGEGVKTFQELYLSNNCTPSTLVLIKSDAFTGNWTQFFDPQRVLARCVTQNPAGSPEYLLAQYGDDKTSPWPTWFPIRVKAFAQYRSKVSKSYGLPCEMLVLWRRSEEAHALYERAVMIQEEFDKLEQKLYAIGLSRQACKAYENCEFAAAQLLFETEKEILERTHGNEYAEIVEAKRYIAMCLREQGNYQESQLLFREVLDVSSRNFGFEDAMTLRVQCGIGRLYRMAGDIVEARKVLNNAQETANLRLGIDHAVTRGILEELSLIREP